MLVDVSITNLEDVLLPTGYAARVEEIINITKLW